MSLARLWQQQGKRDDAQQMLAEVYNWFIEGFDTKDLQEAKALLEELKEKAAVTPGEKRKGTGKRSARPTKRSLTRNK
jgi:predicted ATPase